jgi:High-affinity nickel-transport protein
MPAFVGLLLGMRHALEPDHLAAVSTMATADARGRATGLSLGLAWGLGHTISLTVVAGALATLGAHMPPMLEHGLEAAVAVMVVGLGLRAVWRALSEGKHGFHSTHAHGGRWHAHAAPVEHLHVRRWTLATRPLLVGLMHGLAGSGALTALVLAELPTTSTRLAYIALFGAGSIVGMGLLTDLAGAPLQRLTPKLATALMLACGLSSAGVGLLVGAQSVRLLCAPDPTARQVSF